MYANLMPSLSVIVCHCQAVMARADQRPRPLASYFPAGTNAKALDLIQKVRLLSILYLYNITAPLPPHRI